MFYFLYETYEWTFWPASSLIPESLVCVCVWERAATQCMSTLFFTLCVCVCVCVSDNKTMGVHWADLDHSTEAPQLKCFLILLFFPSRPLSLCHTLSHTHTHTHADTQSLTSLCLSSLMVLVGGLAYPNSLSHPHPPPSQSSTRPLSHCLYSCLE